MAVLGMLRGLGAISPEWEARRRSLGGDQQSDPSQPLPTGEEDDVLKGLAAQTIQPYRPGWSALPGVAASIVGGMAAAKLRSNAQHRQAADNVAWGNYSKAMMGPGMAGPLPQTMPQAQPEPWRAGPGMAGGPTAPPPAAPQPQKPVMGMAGPVRELPDYGFGPLTARSSQGIADEGWRPGPGMAGPPVASAPAPARQAPPVVRGMAGGPGPRQPQPTPQPTNTHDQRVARYEREMQALQPMLKNPGTREFAIKRMQALNDALTATMDPDVALERRYKEAQIEKMQREAAHGNSPSNVREWEYFNRLSPEEQQRYLTMKRAEKYLDLGDRFARPDPINPTGAPLGQTEKNLAEAERQKVVGRVTGERQMGAPKALAAIEAAEAKSTIVLNTIAKARQLVGPYSTGPGALLSGIPGTAAHDLRKLTDTLKANAGFAELQTMRDNSPTGGALGQVAVQELAMLQATITSLEQSQTTEQFNEALNDYEEFIRGSAKRRREAYSRMYGGGAENAPTNRQPDQPRPDPLGLLGGQ